jgi:hypothetical protein
LYLYKEIEIEHLGHGPWESTPLGLVLKISGSHVQSQAVATLKMNAWFSISINIKKICLYKIVKKISNLQNSLHLSRQFFYIPKEKVLFLQVK